MQYVCRLALAFLVGIVVLHAALSALHAQQTFAPGAVVALRGTPHLWIADAQGVLHWGGDTRALTGKHVNWSDRTEVTVEQLRGLTVGDPWLSAGLLKDGDPIYLVKWESDWERPRLLHIQSIADVELFGIDGSNYGRFVLDKATWEARYGMSAASLQRSALPAAVTAAAATPTATPRPTIDPRLQTVLNLIEASGGAHIVDAFEETGASLVYDNISDRAHYRRSANTIVFDESMNRQPREVRAFVLVHEIWHAQFPWTERGQECYVGEFRAELYATLWWRRVYGNAGHSNPNNNDSISRHNHLSKLLTNDIGSGTNTLREQVYEHYAEVCGVPFDYEGMRRLFQFRDIIARNALAEQLGVNPNGSVAQMAVRAYARPISALPVAYVMHLWSEGAPGTYHPLFNVDAFVKAYFADHRKYLQIADTWLTAYLDDPCSVSQDARDWVIANEERDPGTLRAYIRAAVIPDNIVQYVVPGIYEEAEEAFYDNPNLYCCVVE